MPQSQGYAPDSPLNLEHVVFLLIHCKGGGSAEGLSSADLYELKYFPATLFKL